MKGIEILESYQKQMFFTYRNTEKNPKARYQMKNRLESDL